MKRNRDFPRACDADFRAIRDADNSAGLAPTQPIVRAPFTVVIDTREQSPWEFRGITADATKGHAVYNVETVRMTLAEGDYTIQGRESEIRVERKSAADLFATLTHGRKRFERELVRLSSFAFSAVVVEAEFVDLVQRPPTGMRPRSFVGSYVALSQRYPTRWFFAGNRPFAEVMAFRLMERWRRDRMAPPQRRPRSTAHAEARLVEGSP